MNSKMNTALSELKSAGAKGLPTSTQIENAKDKTTWKGKKSNGEEWSLTKNKTESYNCMC